MGIFRTAVNPLRYAVPAARKPGVAFHGHPCDACVASLGAAGKTPVFHAPENTHPIRPSARFPVIHE